ncbi:MAG: HNH endonuclease [Halanaerobiales bacterium]|nr:HNH endonuclease [Halanaerobiales bacterium]
MQQELTKRFSSTNNYIEKYKVEKKKKVLIPDEMKEYLYIYSTNVPYHYRIEFITVKKKKQYTKAMEEIRRKEKKIEEICEMSDKAFQKYLKENYGDEEAFYETRQGIKSYRKLRNTLVKDLKKRYNYQCQICKHSFKDSYGVDYSEGHHIKPFAQFEDHTPENIIILCPNHHRIIHKMKPKFDRKELAFKYDNGYIEYLQLKGHLENS